MLVSILGLNTFKFTTLASHLYIDITICSDTLHCTPSSLILPSYAAEVSHLSPTFPYTSLSCLLTSYLHPSTASLSEMTHYNTSLLQECKPLFLFSFSPVSFFSHTHLFTSFLLSVRPPSRKLALSMFPSTISVFYSSPSYLPPFSPLLLPSLFHLQLRFCVSA